MQEDNSNNILEGNTNYGQWHLLDCQSMLHKCHNNNSSSNSINSKWRVQAAIRSECTFKRIA